MGSTTNAGRVAWMAAAAVLAGVTGGAGCKTASAEAAALTATAPAAGAFAVVELFTSEGCSSCPPADDSLRAIDAEGRRDGRPVYALSFHVDYWDDLGWKDPFSAPAFSDRQRAYAHASGRAQVYTPQMIVNGVDAFTGSDRGRARTAIDAALRTPRQARVALRVERDPRSKGPDGTGGAWVLRYTTEGVPAGATLRVAEVAEGRGHPIASGENAGRTLEHAAVVRRLVNVPSAPEGTVVLPGPAIARDGSVTVAPDAIIAFVQQGSKEIVAATRIDLPRP